MYKMEKKEKKYWSRWYLAVFLFLILQIIIYSWITRKFS